MKQSYIINRHTQIVLPVDPEELFNYDAIVCDPDAPDSDERCLGDVTNERAILTGDTEESLRAAMLDKERLKVRDAAQFLRDAIQQMTTVVPEIANADPETAFNCVLLTTLDASPRYREDKRIFECLRPDFFERLGDPSYNEAYCVFIETRGPTNARNAWWCWATLSAAGLPASSLW